MTEFELTDAFTSNLDVVMTFFMAYLSATSAFLAVAYVAGPKIPGTLSTLVVSVYSLASTFLIFSFQRQAAVIVAIGEQMRALGVSWHPAVYQPVWVVETAAWLAVAMMSLLFAASMWFYLHVKRPNTQP